MFKKRSYPLRIIEQLCHSSNATGQVKLLEDTTIHNFANRLSWLHFTPLFNDIKHVILKHWHLIQHVPRCSNPTFVEFKKKPLWKIFLTHSFNLHYFLVMQIMVTFDIWNATSAPICLNLNSLFILQVLPSWCNSTQFNLLIQYNSIQKCFNLMYLVIRLRSSITLQYPLFFGTVKKMEYIPCHFSNSGTNSTACISRRSLIAW